MHGMSVKLDVMEDCRSAISVLFAPGRLNRSFVIAPETNQPAECPSMDHPRTRETFKLDKMAAPNVCSKMRAAAIRPILNR